MVRRAGWAGLFAIALLGSCSGEGTRARTELLLVADTDMESLEGVRFEISGAGRMESAEGPLRSGEPATLGLVREDGPLGPLDVRAHGLRNGRSIVQRSARVAFVPGKTLVVELHLVQRCFLASCDADETCTERGCEDAAREPSPWTGMVPTLAGTDVTPDAGLADAGREAGTQNGLVRCGGEVDVDLSSDPNHCGQCDNVCRANARNTSPLCVGGTCEVTCRATYGDCDRIEANGCEQSLVSDEHCGACDAPCASGTCSVLGVCR